MADKVTPQSPHGEGSRRLLAEFPPTALEAWHTEVLRLLKGKPFDKIMPTETPEGLTLRPIYTAADVAGLPQLGSLPGEWPHVRGTTASAGRARNGWAIAQELPFPYCATFNEQLRRALGRGQDAIHLVLDAAAKSGSDPDQARAGAVGGAGTSVAVVADLDAAFQDVDLASAPVMIQPGAGALPFLGLLLVHLQGRGLAPGALRGCVGPDPLAELAAAGGLPAGIDALYDDIAVLTRWAQAEAPALRTLAASGHVYHDGGATAVEELACVMAAAIEHLRQAERRGIDVVAMAPRIQFGFSVGTHFFMEIAKLRAARMVWARLTDACGAPDAARAMWIHARTSRLSQTALDPYVNILRATTEAFAAVAGGCDSLHVAPFDDALGPPSELGLRLARNTQIVLREECHLGTVIDPAGGSWFVETLTDQLARAAWVRLQEIEAAGGMLAALVAGLPQRAIAEQAGKRAVRIASRQEILVGVNQYPNPIEGPIERRLLDGQAMHAERSAGVARHRASRAAAQHRAAMSQLETAAGSDVIGVVAALRDAAQAGATLGEMAQTLRVGSREATPQVAAIAPCRGAEAFEALRTAVQAWRARGGRDPQVFLANIGPMGEYMPRLDFARSFFQIGGFAAAADDWFADGAQAGAAALRSRAPIVAIVAPDAVYPRAVPELVAALKAAADPPRVVLAGYPKDQVEALRAAGVEEFIHVKVDALAVLRSLARSLGVLR